MRRVAAAVVAGLVLTLGLVSPARAAGIVLSNVQVAWSSAAHTHVRVTWQESEPTGNRVFAEYPWDNGNGRELPTAAPNQVDFPVAEFFNSPVVRIGVFGITDAGVNTAPTVHSVPFDTLTRGVPVVDQVVAVNGSYTLRWHSAPDPVDENPGDPLDLANVPHHYQVFVRPLPTSVWSPVGSPGPTPTVTFPMQDAPPFTVAVRDSNEWPRSPAVLWTEFYGGRPGPVTVPAATTYGQPTVITGRFDRIGRRCAEGTCWTTPIGDIPRTVVLQARADATSPWYAVGTAQTYDSGSYRFAPVARGTRQYRVAVPDRYAGNNFSLGAIGTPSTALTRPRVLASFADPTVKLGQPARARISVSPAVNVRTTLQRWDGTAWRDQKWVDLKSGWGDHTFAATRRGSSAYRFLVPSSTYGGLPLAWQVSPTFVLTAS
ncbi:hypothetical protein ACQPXM_34540 [Kribbella sp. CA-253562]|uniref:hypothetical protein n=1 Tax=Kribbella sp. CA-253562 TaxID=3239942 RepID=UPI003D8AC59B